MAAGRPDGAERLAGRCQCWRGQRSRVVMDTQASVLFSALRPACPRSQEAQKLQQAAVRRWNQELSRGMKSDALKF